MDVLSPIAEKVGDILESVIPAGGLINEIIEEVEDAIGLTKLLKSLEDEMSDAVKAALAPITDRLEAMLAPIDLSMIEKLNLFSDEFEALQDAGQALPGVTYAQIGDDLAGDTFGSVGGREAGAAAIAGLGGNDVIHLGRGARYDDAVGAYGFGGSGDDTIFGTALNDVIMGEAGARIDVRGDPIPYGDVPLGGAGKDVIFGQAGEDKLPGGADEDILHGGDDELYGDVGDDTLHGGGGDDTLLGGEDADLLRAGEGDDQLYGGGSEDTLKTGAGRNVLDGGEGLDLIRTLGEAGAVNAIFDATSIVHGGAGRDAVIVGDAFAGDAAPMQKAFFDGGANDDALQVGSLDLMRFADSFVNFERLIILGDTPAGKTVTAIAAMLFAFDTLELVGDGPIRIELTEGELTIPVSVHGLDVLGIEMTDMSIVDNPLNGPDKDVVSTVQRPTLALIGAGGATIDVSALGHGITIVGGAGEDTLIGGAGSGLIRPGGGGDIIDDDDDAGDRFDLDGAVGDVVAGASADLDGMVLNGFDSRTDRIRIEGLALAVGEASDGRAGATSVAASIIEGDTLIAFANGPTFTIKGELKKISVARRDGYVEVWSDNIPPSSPTTT
jgi:Ca2+-binding RTX toxin-like protein